MRRTLGTGAENPIADQLLRGSEDVDKALLTQFSTIKLSSLGWETVVAHYARVVNARKYS